MNTINANVAFEYIVMRRYGNPHFWQLCRAYGPRDKTRGVVPIENFRSRRDAIHRRNELNARIRKPTQ